MCAAAVRAYTRNMADEDKTKHDVEIAIDLAFEMGRILDKRQASFPARLMAAASLLNLVIGKEPQSRDQLLPLFKQMVDFTHEHFQKGHPEQQPSA